MVGWMVYVDVLPLSFLGYTSTAARLPPGQHYCGCAGGGLGGISCWLCGRAEAAGGEVWLCWGQWT